MAGVFKTTLKRFWLHFGPQEGLKRSFFWATKPLQDRKKRHRKTHRKQIRKTIKKPRSGEAPGREVPGGAVVNEPLSGPTFQISRKQHLHLSKNFKTRSFKPSTYSKLEASSHQVKLLLHNRFHLQAPLVLYARNSSPQPGGPEGAGGYVGASENPIVVILV